MSDENKALVLFTDGDCQFYPGQTEGIPYMLTYYVAQAKFDKWYAEHHAPLEAENKRLRSYLRTALAFAPQSIAPKGSDPTFYHTLCYEGDVAMLQRLDEIRAALDKGER